MMNSESPAKQLAHLVSELSTQVQPLTHATPTSQLNAIFSAFNSQYILLAGYSPQSPPITYEQRVQLTQSILRSFLTAVRCSQQRGNLLDMMGAFIHGHTEFIELPVNLALEIYQLWEQWPESTICLDMIDCLLMACDSGVESERLGNFILRVSVRVLELLGSSGENDFADTWEAYLELLRSYIFRSWQNTFKQEHWFIFALAMEWMFPNSTPPKASTTHLLIPQQAKVLQLSSQLKEAIQRQINARFHTYSMLVRTFCSEHMFIKLDSLIHSPCANQAELVFRLVQRVGVEGELPKTLDCLMLLITILESDLPRSHNYNQILDISLRMGEYWMSTDAPDSDGRISLYVGQLYALIAYNNVDWLMKTCRAEKSTSTVLGIMLKPIGILGAALYEGDQEVVIAKRLIAGYCSLLSVDALETVLELAIDENFPKVIKLIEMINGHQCFERAHGKSGWCEDYHDKNPSDFEDTDEIELITHGVKAIKELHPQIFIRLMETFDQRQTMLWVLELEQDQSPE